MIFVISGITQPLINDRQIALHKQGDFAGESIFCDNATRNADVQAIENSVLAKLTIHDFHNFLDAHKLLA